MEKRRRWSRFGPLLAQRPLRPGGLSRGCECSLARGGDMVEAAARALFRCCQLRGFEPAEEESRLLQPFECAIEGAVGGEPPRLFALFSSLATA